MRERHFMIDIETTGIDPKKEDLLSIGVLEVIYDGLYWVAGRSVEYLVPTDRHPVSEFAKTHQAELYEKCRNASHWAEGGLRATLLAFFRECGATGVQDTFLMGWNASNFDIPFLVEKGILIPSSYVPGPNGRDVMVGDFHYRVYELGGAVSLAADVLNLNDRSQAIKLAETAACPTVPLPAGKAHDALYDCFKQLNLLNGLIHICRRAG